MRVLNSASRLHRNVDLIGGKGRDNDYFAGISAIVLDTFSLSFSNLPAAAVSCLISCDATVAARLETFSTAAAVAIHSKNLTFSKQAAAV